MIETVCPECGPIGYCVTRLSFDAMCRCGHIRDDHALDVHGCKHDPCPCGRFLLPEPLEAPWGDLAHA